MTVIAFRAGVMAADSRATVETESGGSRYQRCAKMYRVEADKDKGVEAAIIGVAGEGFPALVFVDWYKTGSKEKPEMLVHGDADFSALVLTRKGLVEYDKWCRPEPVLERFWSIGSGCKAALGAMHRGASAYEAAKIACKIDHLCGLPIVTMEL